MLISRQMSSSSADEIIKKCHDVGEKLQAETKSINTAGHHHTNTSNHPVHYLHELPHAAEQRYETLFSQLDRNGKKSILILIGSFSLNSNKFYVYFGPSSSK